MSALALKAGIAPVRSLEAAEHATLILDLSGRIRYCSAAAGQLFRRHPAEMIGGPIAALLPELPIRADTPGYNLAYAIFWFSSAGWRRLRITIPAGRGFLLDVSADTVMLEGKRGLVLVLRLPVARDRGMPR